MTSIDEINRKIEDLEEKVQVLRNEKVKIRLFDHFSIIEDDIEGITNFKLKTSYTSWEAEYNEFAAGQKGSIELTFTRNNKEFGFSMSFIKESPSYEDGHEDRYGCTEKMHTHYINRHDGDDPLIEKILGDDDGEYDIGEYWDYILKH